MRTLDLFIAVRWPKPGSFFVPHLSRQRHVARFGHFEHRMAVFSLVMDGHDPIV
jgi:hypothetical protein